MRRARRRPPWVQLAEVDPSAPPGRVRLYLQSQDEVAAVAAQVDGRAVQLGADLLSVAVLNDLWDLRQGNGRRGRGARGLAPAPPPAGN